MAQAVERVGPARTRQPPAPQQPAAQHVQRAAQHKQRARALALALTPRGEADGNLQNPQAVAVGADHQFGVGEGPATDAGVALRRGVAAKHDVLVILEGRAEQQTDQIEIAQRHQRRPARVRARATALGRQQLRQAAARPRRALAHAFDQIKMRQQRQKAARVAQIVGPIHRLHKKILFTHGVERAVHGHADITVARVGDHAQLRMRAGELGQNSRRGVARAVIHHQHLKIVAQRRHQSETALQMRFNQRLFIVDPTQQGDRAGEFAQLGDIAPGDLIKHAAPPEWGARRPPRRSRRGGFRPGSADRIARRRSASRRSPGKWRAGRPIDAPVAARAAARPAVATPPAG
ncbi:hypothetical protein MAIT1_01998 [Magnetofaba australis IT-1]|uniref:Uncharacterized protein n=1 Tax=Magnetofaba australis IT-1 TaxID=1434232 RepID=A0A1Y2K1V3_9PROT|nr:hypothetical protein MAIT1_01998 [Magnetofaba australis IT-1]